MDPKFFKLIELADKTCRVVLPRAIYVRMRWFSKQLLLKMIKKNRDENIITPVDTGFISCDGQKLDAGLAGNPGLKEKSQDCDLVLCCAFTGRHQILRQIIIESFAAQNADNVRWMLTGSTDEDYQFIQSMAKTTGRVAGFLMANSPLGNKWNACMVHAGMYYRSGLYGITGSDDVIPSTLIDTVLSKLKSDAENIRSAELLPSLYAAKEWLAVIHDKNHAKVSQIVHCSYKEMDESQPVGAGRFYTQAFMDEINFQIFDTDKEKFLDDKGYLEILSRNKLISYLSTKDGPIINVKGNWEQLNSINDFFASLYIVTTNITAEGQDMIKPAVSDSMYSYLFKDSDIN